MSKAVRPRDTKLDSGRELTKNNLLTEFVGRNPQTVPFETGESQNRLRPEIWAGVFRSRDFHEGPLARFPLWKNGQPFHPARQNGRLAQNSFNRREPSRKRGVGIFFSRRGSVSLDSPLVIWASCGVQVGLSHIVGIRVGLDLYLGKPVFLQHVFDDPWCP